MATPGAGRSGWLVLDLADDLAPELALDQVHPGDPGLPGRGDVLGVRDVDRPSTLARACPPRRRPPALGGRPLPGPPGLAGWLAGLAIPRRPGSRRPPGSWFAAGATRGVTRRAGSRCRVGITAPPDRPRWAGRTSGTRAGRAALRPGCCPAPPGPPASSGRRPAALPRPPPSGTDRPGGPGPRSAGAGARGLRGRVVRGQRA